ncbi:MAG: prenyltransferase/squalene oxidase repeat-containing protein [Candidatus Acidiferrales bacterium]
MPDGGWPFIPGAKQAAIEPTALTLLALPSNLVRQRDAAIQFLLHTQNPNGSWPAFAGDDRQGSGFTGLVLYVLNRCNVRGTATNQAVEFLLHTRGWESHWLWRWKFRTTDRHVRFDPDKFGWPWMPETVSWVVPTAYSLLGLKHAFGTSRQDLRQFRIRCGIEMLYDRICPQGGWNAGNGVVYGSPLAPHPDATAAALLAILREPFNNLITASLDWLERRAQTCFTPWSLAWTVLALNAFKRPTGLWIDRLSAIVEHAPIDRCATLAAASLALHCVDGPNEFGVDS